MRKMTVYGMMLLALLTAAMLIGCSDKGTDNTNTGGNNNGPELSSSVFNQGQTFAHTFSKAGVFPYHCGVHPSMKGTITVTAGDAATQNPVSISNFTLPSLTVNVGSTITWTNDDSVPHSVISD